MTHEELYAKACRVIPGGVDSPVRAFNAVGGTPIFVASGEGAYLTLADGRRVLDCCCSWGAMILGHADPGIVEAVSRAAARGTTFGIATPGEAELAERIVARIPFVDKVRLVNSGTEAVMTAIRLARGVTGRDLIIKCEGCYHGHSDGLLVSAGSGAMTAGDGTQPASAGIPAPIAEETLVVPYNDAEAVAAALAAHPGRVAAVILEPVAGNMGCVPPKPGYLQAVQEAAHAAGALFICDEVINAWRFGLGLYSAAAGLEPDIVTMGKVIGGGFPLAAVGEDALPGTSHLYSNSSQLQHVEWVILQHIATSTSADNPAGHTALPATREAAELLLVYLPHAPNSSPRSCPLGQPHYRAAIQQQQGSVQSSARQ